MGWSLGAPSCGLLFLVTAPSGSGKDSVLRILRERNVDLHWVATAVTRQPRRDEIHGRSHLFMTPEEFSRARSDGGFLETACVYGRWYGTPIDQVREPLRRGEDVMLRLDVQGARELTRRYPEAITVYLAPPSPAEAVRRLRRRSTESEEEIERRVQAMYAYELAFADEADYCVPNLTGALDCVAQNLWAVVTAERLRARPRRLDPERLRPVPAEPQRI